jgi:hypothetical protein
MHQRNAIERSRYGSRTIAAVRNMPLTKEEKEQLARLEHQVGLIVGFMAGGPMGARMSRPVVDVFQESPFNQAYKELLFSTLPQRPSDQNLLDAVSAATRLPATSPPKKKRRASAKSKKYGKCFKKLQHKYKKKNGSWKKDGFKRCAAAARRCAKK